MQSRAAQAPCPLVGAIFCNSIQPGVPQLLISIIGVSEHKVTRTDGERDRKAFFLVSGCAFASARLSGPQLAAQPCWNMAAASGKGWVGFSMTPGVLLA